MADEVKATHTHANDPPRLATIRNIIDHKSWPVAFQYKYLIEIGRELLEEVDRLRKPMSVEVETMTEERLQEITDSFTTHNNYGQELLAELLRVKLDSARKERDRYRLALERIFLLKKCPIPGDGCSQCVALAALPALAAQPKEEA